MLALEEQSFKENKIVHRQRLPRRSTKFTDGKFQTKDFCMYLKFYPEMRNEVKHWLYKLSLFIRPVSLFLSSSKLVSKWIPSLPPLLALFRAWPSKHLLERAEGNILNFPDWTVSVLNSAIVV